MIESEPSEKTIRNMKDARAHSLWIGRYHVEYKLWTGFLVLWPKWIHTRTPFFNEGFVHWDRYYWLTVGVSITWPDEEGGE